MRVGRPGSPLPIVGVIASVVVVAGLLAARHRPGALRALARRGAGRPCRARREP
ncbi:MAG: hypothetical protein ACRDOI_45715 [Trebonia sp.]